VEEWLTTLDGKPCVYVMKCRIVGYEDADTFEVRWLGEGPARNWRVRFKDQWIVENEDAPEEHARILAEQKALLGDVGDLVWIRNNRHHRTYERIEARVDAAG
jgi:hypothetical protein